jgi:cytochrome d ubiquinol oxidase subunit I
MLTRDAISPVAAPAVGFTLGAFIIVYLVVFGAGIFYVLRLFAAGPDADVAVLHEGPLRSLAMTPEMRDQNGN